MISLLDVFFVLWLYDPYVLYRYGVAANKKGQREAGLCGRRQGQDLPMLAGRLPRRWDDEPCSHGSSRRVDRGMNR